MGKVRRLHERRLKGFYKRSKGRKRRVEGIGEWIEKGRHGTKKILKLPMKN